MKNIITLNIDNVLDQKRIDKIIDFETKRKIEAVKGSENFGVMTACKINGDFICVTSNTLSHEMYALLKLA